MNYKQLMKPHLIILLMILLSACGKASKTKHPTIIEQVYKNPIISADFSDPDVIRVENDYYMTASSFNMVPGLPILHSKDLVNWKLIGHGIQHLPDALFSYKNRNKDQLDYNVPRLGKGVYAPAIRYHNGYFWIFWGDPDAGVYQIKTKNPAGTWSKPVLIKEASGWIDPSPIWDKKTGKAYLAHAHAASRRGINERIDVWEMNWEGTALIGEPVTVFDAKDSKNFPTDKYQSVIEGTKFMKRGEWFYILCPAGGVEFGWQTALRSKSPKGPYEIKTICETGNTGINGPHQGGLVESHTGEWWFIHFQSVGTLGRIVRLEPAHWTDNDWPVVGIDPDNDGIGNPVESYTFPHPAVPFKLQNSDDFSSKTLGLQWQWPANPQKNWYKLEKGKLVLPALFSANQELERVPQVLTQMFPNFNFSATVKMNASNYKGIRTGLTSLGRKSFDIGVEEIKDTMKVSMRFGLQTLGAKTVTGTDFWLRLDTQGTLPKPLKYRTRRSKEEKETHKATLQDYQLKKLDRYGNGIIYGQFLFSTNGEDFSKLGPEFEVRSGAWIGARIGLYCVQKDTSALQQRAVNFDEITFTQY
ncbi:glycoside hydrolase family 43 protein [Flavivirga algicola]|uniref:Glycosyl hydrolase 43 family protein n=1 Tax=Flavivirga algicola TaxID=2729136 RepID=A0ABX1RV69_9FLAO|nr:glycoside hydrolase 43 family protein [Flavivirga algicola]NMH86119.1 glycosyl hydrolase 43 family protein [Flavivirga algicola]